MKRITVLVSLALALCSGFARAESQWLVETVIRVPYNNTLFLARDSNNDVYATTFNTAQKSGEVVAFKISDALGSRPRVTAFDRFVAPSMRGYSGIAVDEKGNIYLSADQGDGLPSFIKKYKPNMEIDRAFGSDGILATNKVRIQGLATYSNYLVAAVTWGRFLVVDSSGRFLGMTQEIPGGRMATIRDIDFIPSTQEVVGVDRDNLYVFTGGSLSKLGSYVIRTMAKGNGRQAAGSAVYYNPKTDEIFYNLNQGKRMAVYNRTSRQIDVVKSVTVQQGASQPADVVISSDGTTMFVSDLHAPHIIRYRGANSLHVAVAEPKSAATVAASQSANAPGAVSPEASASAVEEKVNKSEAAKINTAVESTALSANTPSPPLRPLEAPAATSIAPPAPPVMTPSPPLPALAAIVPASSAPSDVPTSAAEPAGSMPWELSIDRAFQRAVAENKKVVLFFYSQESVLAQQVLINMFSDDRIAKKHPDLVWVNIDVTMQPETMARYSLIKVPVLLIFSAQKQELKRLEGTITADMFALAYTQL